MTDITTPTQTRHYRMVIPFTLTGPNLPDPDTLVTDAEGVALGLERSDAYPDLTGGDEAITATFPAGATVTALPDDHWASDPDYPVGDWQFEVSNDDTRLGYWDWVANKRDLADD